MANIQSSRPGFVSLEYITRAIENVLALLPPVPPTPWIDIADKPTEFPPASHNHTISNVFGLEDILSSINSYLTEIASVIVTKSDLIDGKVPASQLPSYVDDVLEFANLAAFPATGEAGKIYINIATNEQYRWSGSAYIKIVSSPGSSDAIPEGATNRYYTAARAALKADVDHSHSIEEISGLEEALSGKEIKEGFIQSHSPSINWNAGRKQFMNAGGDLNLAFSGGVDGDNFLLEITATGGADRTITLPSGSYSAYTSPFFVIPSGKIVVLTGYKRGANYVFFPSPDAGSI